MKPPTAREQGNRVQSGVLLFTLPPTEVCAGTLLQMFDLWRLSEANATWLVRIGLDLVSELLN